MSKLLWIGFVTGSDPEHDVGGVEAPPTSPIFGEHHAQIRIVGRCFYIRNPDRDPPPVVMASDPSNINQSALKPAPVHQRRCSLTRATESFDAYLTKPATAEDIDAMFARQMAPLAQH